MRASFVIGIGGMSSLMVAGLAPPSSGRPRVSARAPAAPAMFTDVYGDNDAGALQIPTRLTQHRLLLKEEERDITNDVRELRRWSDVREELERVARHEVGVRHRRRRSACLHSFGSKSCTAVRGRLLSNALQHRSSPREYRSAEVASYKCRRPSPR